MRLSVRRQTADDAPAVRSMLAALGDDAARSRLFGGFADLVEEAGRTGLVALDGDELVGHAVMRRIGPHAAEFALEVAAGHRGNGIGTQLADAVVEAGREAGMELLIAEVQRDNGPMLRVLTATGVPLAVTDAGDHLLVELEL